MDPVYTAGESSNDMGTVPSWELRVEGRLMEPIAATQTDGSDPHQHQSSRFPKRKFSSFFKSLVIELDKDIYGPDNHLVEWHRRPDTSETDGFQVKRPGDRNVKCTILLLLDYQPIKYKLDTRLARLLGIHTDTRARIIEALWQYVKTHKLQDGTEKDYINCDIYLKQIFGCERMRFMEIPQKLPNLLLPPDPIVITHLISVEGELKKAALYDIEVELDDPIKTQMSQFLSSQQNHNDIMTADDKKPLEFIERWLVSQHNDLKAMTDTVGQTLEERQAAFYGQSWIPEAVSRHFYRQISARKAELDARLNVRNN